jgi:hypothetical protein
MRQRKWPLWVFVAFVLYVCAGFFLVPALVKWQLLKILPRVTHRSAAVREVRFNPFVLSMTVRGLSLAEANGTSFASFEEFYANFQLSSIFRRAWTFDRISLTQPRAEIVLDQQKHFNFENLIEPEPAAKPAGNKRIPRLLVFDLSVTNGHAGFHDLSLKTPFHTTYEPINFRLKGFTTKPREQSPYSLEASSDTDRTLSWAGTISAQPLRSEGSIHLTGVRLPRHAPYLEDFSRVHVADGTLDIGANYKLAADTNGLDMVVSGVVLTLSQLSLQDPATGDTVASMPSVELREGSFDWRARQVGAGSILVAEPSLLVRRLADGSINIPSLVLRRTVGSAAQIFTNAPANPAPAEPGWTFTLNDYQLKGGTVRFEDALVPGGFQSTLRPVSIHVEHLSNMTNAQMAVHVDLKTEAEETVALSANYSITPVRGDTTVTFTNVDLMRYLPYLRPHFTGTVGSGRAGGALNLVYELRGDSLRAVLTNSELRVTDLQIGAVGAGQTLLSIPQFGAQQLSGSLAEKVAHVGGITATGGVVQLVREKNGAINLLGLLAASTNSLPSTNKPTANGQSWSVSLDQLALRDWTVHFLDEQTGQPGKIDCDQLALTLNSIDSSAHTPVSADFSTHINGSGSVAVKGTVLPQAQTADLNLTVDGLDLRGAQPWIDEHLNLRIESGTASTRARTELRGWEGGIPKVHLTGELGLHGLVTVDRTDFKELARLEQMEAKGIDFSWLPNQASLEEVRLSGVRASVILNQEKQLNLSSVILNGSTNTPAAPTINSATPAASTSLPAPAGAKEPFPVRFGELKLENMTVAFRDESIHPACAFEVQQLDGTVKGLSTAPGAPADIQLAGRVDEASPFGLQAKVNPPVQDLTLNITFTNHNLQLTPFSTYFEKYAGHPLNKGRMSLDLQYDVNAKRLKAQNKVQIDQLMLGPRNDSPDATKLPVKLAVALLKDSSGRIDLDVPVEGRLDDPQFSVGGVVLKVLGNLITKAVTSPFKLIGALVGGGEELSYIEFEPGDSVLSGAETNKLEKIIQALEKRPALSLEIEGSADPNADRAVLARRLVQEQIRSDRLKELSSLGQTPPSTEQFQPEPADYERLLRASVAKTFGTNLTEALRAAVEKAAAATNGLSSGARVGQGPGFWARVGSIIHGGQERAATRQAHQAAQADALLLQRNPDLARLSTDQMEMLLGAQKEVPAESLQQLMLARGKAVQAYLLASQRITGERLFLVTPKPESAQAQGEPRVHLGLE